MTVHVIRNCCNRFIIKQNILVLFCLRVGGREKIRERREFFFQPPSESLNTGYNVIYRPFFSCKEGWDGGRSCTAFHFAWKKKKKKKGKKVLFSVIFIFGRYTVLHFQHRHIFPYATFLLNNNTSILQSSTLLCRFFRNKRSPLPTLPSLASPSRWVFSKTGIYRGQAVSRELCHRENSLARRAFKGAVDTANELKSRTICRCKHSPLG